MILHPLVRVKYLSITFLILMALASSVVESQAADLQLSWSDNSSNESGFVIERKTGTSGSFVQIATVGANINTYTNTGLTSGTTYCYRVKAYNSAGSSAYTPQGCAPASTTTSTAFNFSLSNSGNKTVIRGQSVSTVIYATLTSGSSKTIALSTSGLPSGATASYSSSTSCSPTCSRALTIATSSSTPTGTYTILVNGTGGGITRSLSFNLAVTSSGSTGTVSNTGSTVSLEAEKGSVAAPMVIASDTRASQGKFVHVPDGRGNNYNDTSKGGSGEVRFTVGIPQSGTRALWARTIAPNGGSDSFYVTRNGALVREWTVPPSTSWKWNKVANVSLSAGTVNLAFRQREDGTKLDQIILTTNLNYVPGGSTLSAATAAATLQASENHALSVSVVKSLTNSGSGNGTITSAPGGINCGTDCVESYGSGTTVRLIATPAAGSVFAGWSGNADCRDGTVIINADIACTATFSPQSVGLHLVKSGSGTGSVVSTPWGINCGSDCSESFASGTQVKLTATAAAGSVFRGWSGGGCGAGNICTVLVSGSTSVSAVFESNEEQGIAKIGIYRPSTGDFFLDRNGDGHWDGCKVDLCMKWLAQHDGVPVAGDWDGNGKIRIGTFDAATGTWYLDVNGNGHWDGCKVDRCIQNFGSAEDVPVIRSNGNNRSGIGVFRAGNGSWKFDVNGNNAYDGCQIDNCYADFGSAGSVAVIGDWDGNGKDNIGYFSPESGFWRIDSNGNGVRNTCSIDKCYSGFGKLHDLPVAGDWDGSGKAKFGVFRPSTGQWFLDKNANGRHDSCGTDICINAFGLPGDQPLAGKW